MYYRSKGFVRTIDGQKELYIMTFLQFQKELYYISEGIVLKNHQKDLRRCEGFQKVLYSAKNSLKTLRGKREDQSGEIAIP